MGSILHEMSSVDVVILGYLDTCPDFVIDTDERFRSKKTNRDGLNGQMFNWYKAKPPNGPTVAYLGCAFVLWGSCA